MSDNDLIKIEHLKHKRDVILDEINSNENTILVFYGIIIAIIISSIQSQKNELFYLSYAALGVWVIIALTINKKRNRLLNELNVKIDKSYSKFLNKRKNSK